MTDGQWDLGPSAGELHLTTGVAGRAAKLGHRLTIAMTAWSAHVSWSGGEPAAVDLTIEMDSLQVLRGQGGVTPLSAPEKMLARANALKSLDAKKFPQSRFATTSIEKTGDCYRLIGTLEIHGASRERVLDLGVEDLGDSWRLSCEAEVKQSDFGVKPYSLMMGALKVADPVAMTFTCVQPKSTPRT